MYKVKDNAEAQLQFGISSVATTLVVKEGQGAKFPEVPFLVVLNKRNSDWEITKSEKVEVSSVNGDQFTISRGYEWTTPSDFSADDFVSLFVLARHIEELQTEVAKKADQTDVQSVAQKTSTLEEKVEAQEQKVGKLEEAGTPDHLAEKIIVGEKYFLEDPLILMDASQKEQLNTTWVLGKDHMCKELHIQRISSWVASNKVNLCVLKAGTPLDLIVEIRKGQRVDLSEDEAYWIWGDELLASGKVSRTVFDAVDNAYNEIEVELDKSFVLPEGELISVVLYQQGKTMNPNNYYIVRCLGDRHSEAFRGIGIQDWNGKDIKRWTPYATSPAFLSKVLVKQYITDKLDVSGQPGSISIPGRYVANDSQYWADYSFISLPGSKKIFNEMVIFGALQVELDYDLNFAGNWSNQQVSFWIYGNFVEMNSTRYNNVTNGKEIFNRMLGTDWMDKGRRVAEKWRLVRRIDLWQPSTIHQLGLAVTRQNIGNSPKLNYTLKNTLIITAQQIPNYTWKKFYPREVKDIGQKASCTTFGRHVDGGWVA